MNKYELTVILTPSLDEEAAKAELQSISELVTRFGGTIEKVDEWGKRRLAYEIKKFNEGIYSFITFSSKSETPTEIERRMRIKENVLRYLITRQEA